MKKTFKYALIFFIVSAFGCLPAQKGPTPKPTVTYDNPPQLAFSGELEKRVRYLITLLEDKNLSEEDKEIALSLLSTYQELQRLSSSLPSEAQYLSVIHDLFTSLDNMDKKYFSKEKSLEGNYTKTISLFSEKRDSILDSYISGDFQAVIDSCIELKTMFGPDSLTPDIGLLFALSLAKQGIFDEAITIGEGIARELETSPDLVKLRIGIAEWYLQQGQREKAIRVYEKLADTLDEDEMDIHFLSRKIAQAEKAGQEIEPAPKQIQSQRAEKMNLDDLLKEVEKLLEENRFSEARDLLFAKGHTVHTESESETIRHALKMLDVAEADYLEKKISMISMKRDMEQARRLLEEEKYEEVISTLEAIEPEEENSREIRELKQFAIEKLINRERNRAAKIFLRAKETQDPEKKGEYFLMILQILKPLVDKYPQSPLNERLKSHINIVENELAKLKE